MDIQQRGDRAGGFRYSPFRRIGDLGEGGMGEDLSPHLVGEPMTLDVNGRWPFNHASIPWFILDDPPEGMGPYELAAYCYYRRHANFRTGACFVAIDTIAKRLGASWTRIRKARDWLKKKGLIRVVKTRGGQPDLVVTLYPPSFGDYDLR